MDLDAINHVRWCDLELVLLKIHSAAPWDTKMIRTCESPDLSRPTVNVYLCHEDDVVFNEATSYREKMMRRGSYRGHTFGLPAKLRCLDDWNIALAHPDPGAVIWAYVIKYVLTVHASRRGMLHLKGAAVAFEDRAMLFLGRGGSGKTELVTALRRSGAGLIGNTHLIVDRDAVCGVKSNMRVREHGCDVYVPVDQALGLSHGWLPIGGVFWLKYRTDATTEVMPMPLDSAKANVRYFAEAVRNWELKEDLADHSNGDPFEFAVQINRLELLVDEFCERHPMNYLTTDVMSTSGMDRLLSVLGSTSAD